MSQTSPNLQKSVCFVAFDATPLIFPDAAGTAGGAETRALLLAKSLASELKKSVSVVVRDSKWRPETMRNGFTVVTKVDLFFRIRRFVSEHVTVLTSFPWLRIKTWHFNLIWQIPLLFVVKVLNRNRASSSGFGWLIPATRADVYGCMGVSERTADVFDEARSNNRKTILFIASNADLDDRYRSSTDFRNAYGDAGVRCMAALTYADVIVCQTENQQTLLKQNFGRDSYFLPNPFDTDGWMAALQASPDLPLNIPARFAFWIGRSDLHHKRPDLLLQVASLCPEVQFLMVMNTFDFKVASQIRAQRPSNVVLIDRIPFHKMPACFRRAAMFVSTSNPDFEGFPNVFLQAAASTVPVVSLSTDPGFVTDHNAGVVCEGDIHRLAAQVKLLWSDPERGKRLGENGRNYVRHYHSASDSRNRLEEIFNAVFR